MNKNILACILVAMPALSYAEISQCDLLPKLVHINGITTSRDDADESLIQLQKLAEERIGPPIEGVLAYNRTKNFFADIQQTFYQLKMQDPNTQDEKIAEALLGSIPPDMNMQVAEAAKKYYLEKQERAALAQLTIDEQSDIIQAIKSNIQAGDKILLVPHSQGNLFANSTYTRLTSIEGIKPDDIKIFGVASPADRVLGNGAYVTSKNDVVIQSLAKIPFLNVLPRQLNLPISGADPLGHGFKEIYLNGAMTGRDAVWTGVEGAIGELNKPNNNYYQGTIWEKDPLVMSFSTNTYPHVISPHGEAWIYEGNLPSMATVFRNQEFADLKNKAYTFSTPCKNNLNPDVRITPGAYEIHNNTWSTQIRDSITPKWIGFSIQTQGKFYHYEIETSSLPRSPTYDRDKFYFDDNVTANFSYYLGKVIVTQDAKTNNYILTWQPTPELK